MVVHGLDAAKDRQKKKKGLDTISFCGIGVQSPFCVLNFSTSGMWVLFHNFNFHSGNHSWWHKLPILLIAHNMKNKIPSHVSRLLNELDLTKREAISNRWHYREQSSFRKKAHFHIWFPRSIAWPTPLWCSPQGETIPPQSMFSLCMRRLPPVTTAPLRTSVYWLQCVCVLEIWKLEGSPIRDKNWCKRERRLCVNRLVLYKKQEINPHNIHISHSLHAAR